MNDVKPLRPKMLDDVTDVETKLVAMLEEGRGREVIRMMLALLVDLRERHTSSEARLHGLLRKLYGRSSEKVAAAQLELYLAMLGTPKVKAEGDKPPPNLPAPDVKPAPKGGGGRKPLPDNLPVVVVEIPVPDAERACPYCGKERTSCGHEVAQLVEYFPPSFKVIEERREKLVCRPCGEITTAPLGDRVIEGGRPCPQLVAALIVDKWQDATPHNRNTDVFAGWRSDRDAFRAGINTTTEESYEGGGLMSVSVWRETRGSRFLLQVGHRGSHRAR